MGGKPPRAAVDGVADRASPDRRDFGETRRFAPDAVGARVYNIVDACTSGEEQLGLV
jgi:hypothetical protein